MPAPSFLLRVLLAATLAALAACSSLPPLPPRSSSSAVTAASTESTTLAAIERASLAGARPGESGFRLLPTGDFAFDARLALVQRAERSLDVQYYLIQRDGVGLQFLRELRDAARRGVRVRLLVDDLYAGRSDEIFAAFAAVPNVEVRLFNPLPVRGQTLIGRVLFSLHQFGRVNHRMHNKLLVADNRFAVTGGRNMGDEYFMRSAAANFIDMDVLAAGPVVRDMSAVFDRYWNSTHAWPAQAVVTLPLDANASRRRFDETVQGAATELEAQPSDPLSAVAVSHELEAGRVGLTLATARFLADVPEKVGDRRRDESVSTVIRQVMAVVRDARSEVVITSPYFIPGPIGLELMKNGIANGVRAVVLTNSLGATDEPLVHWRYARYRRDMLQLGVELYELSPELARTSGSFGDFGRSFGRLHAKVVLVDRRYLFVGSMNVDARSAWSNTEAGLLIDSPALSESIAGLLTRDRNESVYRLHLAADGETIEWLTTDADGKTTVLPGEPHGNWLLRLKMWLLEPFTSEELL